MKQLRAIHPGQVLKEEFLLPLGLSVYRLAKEIEVPQTRLGAIIKGNRCITVDTAYRLGKYFNTSTSLWLNMQKSYDLRKYAHENNIALETLPEFQIPVVKGRIEKAKEK
jgi:addiction module HigA family antidote